MARFSNKIKLFSAKKCEQNLMLFESSNKIGHYFTEYSKNLINCRDKIVCVYKIMNSFRLPFAVSQLKILSIDVDRNLKLFCGHFGKLLYYLRTVKLEQKRTNNSHIHLSNCGRSLSVSTMPCTIVQFLSSVLLWIAMKRRASGAFLPPKQLNMPILCSKNQDKSCFILLVISRLHINLSIEQDTYCFLLSLHRNQQLWNRNWYDEWQ